MRFFEKDLLKKFKTISEEDLELFQIVGQCWKASTSTKNVRTTNSKTALNQLPIMYFPISTLIQLTKKS